MDHFADRLLAACREKGAPVCVGLDPVYQRLPAQVRSDGPADPTQDAAGACAAIETYCRAVIDAVAPHVPAIKPQFACFERYLWPGAAVLHRVIAYGQEKGLIVIGDGKRGDIGISAEHYAAGCLGSTAYADLDRPAGPDALTINSYLGPDSIQPFVNQAAAEGKGLFVLVRTSNPGSDALQTLPLADGRSVSEAVADFVAESGEQDGCVGQSGYSLLGAVIGATKAQELPALRERMPQQIFLVLGLGAQGATPKDMRACFKPDGTGALISASRLVLYAYEALQTEDWRGAIEQAAVGLNQQIGAIVN